MYLPPKTMQKEHLRKIVIENNSTGLHVWKKNLDIATLVKKANF